MTLIRFAGIAAALLTASSLVWTTAAGHPSDSGIPNPTTFPAVAKVIRDEMRAGEEASRSGDFADAVQHAVLATRFTDEMPRFLLEHASALEDSAVGRILRAGIGIRTIADAMRLAAEARDSTGVFREAARFADLYAVLDAYVPKQYVCPMHCETAKIYAAPGSCPVCRMHLQLVTSDRYSVEVTAAGGRIRAGKPTWLEFQIKDPAGFEVESLLVVHEKLLHLMIVSQDLSRFAHEHPVLERNGRFRLRHTFPAPGRYVLYHDFTPDSVGMQVVPVEVTVEGEARPPIPLVVDADQPKRAGGYEARLDHTPLEPGVECAMTFTLTRSGKPVSDLERFLGAGGHLVMVSDDRAYYVHSHPLEQDPTGGPSIRFNMRFVRTGLYKAWGQFQHQGRVLTFPFVVRVAAEAGDPEITRRGAKVAP